MKQKVKDPKAKLSKIPIHKAPNFISNSNNNISSSNENIDSITDDLFVLPFLSDSLIRRHDQLMQLNQKNRNSNLPTLPYKSPFTIGNLKQIDSSKIEYLRKPSLSNAQPNSAVSNKSSKSNMSNFSNGSTRSSISTIYDSQKSLREFESSDGFIIATKYKLNDNQATKKLVFLTPDATYINKYQTKKGKDNLKPKGTHGILKNKVLAPIQNAKLESESFNFKEKSFETLEDMSRSKMTTPSTDRSNLPKITSPVKEMHKNLNQNHQQNQKAQKIKHESGLNNRFLQKFNQFRPSTYQIEQFMSSQESSTNSFSYDFSKIKKTSEPMLNDYNKNRLSQINEESSNNATPSLVSQWSSSFASIISDDLDENDMFDNLESFVNRNQQFIKPTQKHLKQAVN